MSLCARSTVWLITLAFAVHTHAASELHTRSFIVPHDFLSLNIEPGDPAAPAVPADPFAIPPAEPRRLNGKIPRHSSQQILEATGVTFPEGASAFFNPTTSQLIVTNTQLNLDIVDAFVGSFIDEHFGKTLAHQLIILEGPGELIRATNAAASRTANARKELDLLLDYAKNPGSNVRAVANAFLEGKSGIRNSTSAVREHMHATGLDLDTKGHTTAALDLSPLGVVFEIEPLLRSDGITIESSLVVKLHPVTPRIRQITVSELLSGHDAEFPFSITAGAEFNTQLVSTAGATKLIGVSPPAGLTTEKADVLWAAFLTSTIRDPDKRIKPTPSAVAPKTSDLISVTFPAPPGLLESLMETNAQPLREWLEKVQGITFPPGAVLEYKGQHLHVTNTPAMIEAISALIAHAESIAQKTVAFTLHTIEAPAAQLRDLTRQSVAAGADDTAVFTAAEAAVNAGEARFIDSAFLEAKSGIRATHEAVSEHAFLSGFGFNAQKQPEVTFEMRKIGSLFEIEPTVYADGRTVQLTYSHEIHPAPPETRGAHFRDPASGKPFAMPATDFHVLKTTSALAVTKGDIKLISLQKPTGRNAEGKLWATFLKCDVVPQIPKPVVIQDHKPADKAVPSVDPKAWSIKPFRVPPDFLASGPGAPKITAKRILEAQGIEFPEGASADYNPSTNTMIVRNTNENLVRVAAYVDEILAQPPKTLTFTTHVFQAPGPLLRRLASQAASKSDDRAELDELLSAVKASGAQSLGTTRIETRSGVRATAQQGVAHTALDDVRISKQGTPEIITQTRNVGFQIELEPTIGADGVTVELTLAPEFHTAPPFEHREHILDTQGRKLEFPLADYHTAKVVTGITMHDGTVHLLSLYKPVGKPEFEKEDILQAVFITCDVLRTGE